MIYGYTRNGDVSDLNEKCDVIFIDYADQEIQPKLNKLLKVIREKDTLVIGKLSNLSADPNKAFEILTELHENNIRVDISNIGSVAKNPIGEAIYGTIKTTLEGFERATRY